jgi:hypothetical protein
VRANQQQPYETNPERLDVPFSRRRAPAPASPVRLQPEPHVPLPPRRPLLTAAKYSAEVFAPGGAPKNFVRRGLGAKRFGSGSGSASLVPLLPALMILRLRNEHVGPAKCIE